MNLVFLLPITTVQPAKNALDMVSLLILKQFSDGIIFCTKISFSHVSQKHMISMVVAVSQVHEQKTLGENQLKYGSRVNQSSGVISKQVVACLKNETS